MIAPRSICAAVGAVLDAAGVASSVLHGAPAQPGKQELVLDRNYVIASGFAFEATTRYTSSSMPTPSPS